MLPRPLLFALATLTALLAPTSVLARSAADEPAGEPRTMSAAQLFDFADAARTEGDDALAERAYRALTNDTDPRIADEARFRLAMMLAQDPRRRREAATLLRRILDADPENVGVRLALARVLGQLGDRDGATRELRAARAVGLPPAVERQVRFFEAALSREKRSGVSLEVALAPSSNITRATGADTLDTVLGKFTLSDEAKARSGIGISGRSQAFHRAALAPGLDWRIAGSAAATLYRDGNFNDMAVQADAGPEFALGRSHVALSGLVSHRWYGGAPYALTYGATGDARIPVGRRTQLRLSGRAVRQENRRNRLQDLDSYALGAGIDRAIDARSGLGLRIDATRDIARDPGYSNASGSARAFLYRQFGRTTAVLDGTYRRLEADRRLLLYPERRRDDFVQASLSGTFRGLSLGTFAPFLRLRYERNWSTVGIYDFERTGADVGLTAAF